MTRLMQLILLPGILLLSVSACSPSASEQDKQYDYSIFALGTLIDISMYGVSQKQADTAFEELQKDFERFHQDWSAWTNGDLAEINRQIANDKPVNVPAHLLPILKASFELSEQSNNYYNPTIGNLINLWQFHKYQEKNIRPPGDKKIQQLVKQDPVMSDLHIDKQNRLNSTNPAVQLNFGAFAKGYGIELAINRLKSMGIKNAVINAGGDLSVIGQHGERAWNIGIRHPRKQSLLASVELRTNESAFTSGDYERFYTYQGRRYHHILDPNTGYPTQDAQSVTVIHSDAGRADAAATALSVAGRKHWRQVAEKMGIEYVMLIDGSGNIHMTSAMQKRIKFLDKVPTSAIIVE
ncbi:MAG: FAD:protein FMN transferase [Proteobacteria bacterium]|nr:FAD:protein FMN transferase [Pseudomonadota bacterium]